ncbi:C40 family peptidase [Marinococcus luteus]|uniref:C40 family peptidase n=1 Tax=Marinococcus luteus TaxID=1122204 RepID=UPI002ACD1E9D|nr:C40 family peptidase [Marinococcus luteus]MDZ5782144.1 C40 family peptidase [Marinococcus luteus]
MAQTLGHQLITYGEDHLGTPYEFGGDGTDTFDCSGFVRYVIEYVTGESIPRTAASQSETGTPISDEDLRTGDLLFWKDTRSEDLNHNDVTHVGFYVDGETFLGAQESTGVAFADSTRDYWQSRYVGARRVVDSTAGPLTNVGGKGDLLRVVASQVNYRSEPSWDSGAVAGKANEGEAFTIERRVPMEERSDLFELLSGTYITTHENYVEVVPQN